MTGKLLETMTREALSVEMLLKEATVRRSQEQRPGQRGRQAQRPRGGVSVVCRDQCEGQRLHGGIRGRQEGLCWKLPKDQTV